MLICTAASRKYSTNVQISQHSAPFVWEATAVVGQGWTAELTDADTCPSHTATAKHNNNIHLIGKTKQAIFNKNEQMQDN